MKMRGETRSESVEELEWQPPLATGAGSRRALYHHGHGRLRRPRSHNGCLTCKRRKVRCDEGKPRCGHCDRLNLKCDWRDSRSTSTRQQQQQHPLNSSSQASVETEPDTCAIQGQPQTQSSGGAAAVSAAGAGAGAGANSGGIEMPFQFPQGFETPSPLTELFGFASSIMDPANDASLFREATNQLDFHAFLSSPGLPIYTPENALVAGTGDGENQPHGPATLPREREFPHQASDRQVSDGLEMTAPPPILEMVENGPRWASARAILAAMAAASLMVRHSVMAFVALQIQRSESRDADHRFFYNKAERELAKKTTPPTGKSEQNGDELVIKDDELKYVLTTMFLLSYIDLLTDGVHLAQSHLKLAYKAVQLSNKKAFGPIERRVISWIRLVDARLASAGGEGCFVNDDSGLYSPGESQAASNNGNGGAPEPGAPGAEEVLYDMLCGPGSLFFQEVESITGRITKIDHYHRSRGTVQDETEVMAIAAEIQRDLAALYERRPALMDHAVAGNMNDNLSPLLAPSLAKAIICSYRTYLATFHGCYIHIHRIAHRHLPRPKELERSLAVLKELIHAMVESSETLPVNVLWPLFLWGCEEDDPDECRWIVDTIRSLGRVTTNAQITADLLHEVQTRQQGCKGRVDIRSVTVELFKANFAII